MKSSFFVEAVGGINLNAVDPVAAKPKIVLHEFLADAETLPALLRNEADRIEKIAPPPGVGAQHARLVTELRAYASVLDDVLADAKRDGLDEQAWLADRRVLEPQIAAATSAIARTLEAFRARGYSIFVKPSD